MKQEQCCLTKAKCLIYLLLHPLNADAVCGLIILAVPPALTYAHLQSWRTFLRMFRGITAA
jgi:hypothetical protein